MTPTQQSILDYLKGATSASAKSAPEIYTDSGIKSILIQPALDYLYEKAYINRCLVTKGELQYIEYWPTAFKGYAMTKDPIPAFGKEPKVKPLEPASWAALKQSKSENKEGVHMTERPFKASQIRELINANQGISHEELIHKLAGESTDKIYVRKASDMITYTINAGGYTKRNVKSAENDTITKRYYTNAADSNIPEVDLAKPSPMPEGKKPLTEMVKDFVKAVEAGEANPIEREIFNKAPVIPEVLKPYVEAAGEINCVAGLSALNSQVGGDHYKKLGIYQPWEVFKRWMTPEEFKGAMKKEVITYLAREQDKGGREDIEKAMHTMQIYLELTS